MNSTWYVKRDRSFIIELFDSILKFTVRQTLNWMRAWKLVTAMYLYIAPAMRKNTVKKNNNSLSYKVTAQIIFPVNYQFKSLHIDCLKFTF
jgi:hypothetical protein